MWKLLSSIQKNLVWSIPLAMIAGLATGFFLEAGLLRYAILPLTFLMVFPMMVSLPLRELLTIGNPRLQIATQAVNFLILPGVGWVIGRIFFQDRPLLATGLFLTSLLPTSGMTITWTGLAKGNVPAAVRMTLFGLILGSLLAPFYLKLVMGAVVSIPLADTFVQIALTIFLPMVAGAIVRETLLRRVGAETFKTAIQPKLPLLSTVGVLGIVFVAMALKARALLAQPSELVTILIPLLVLYAANFSISMALGKLLFPAQDAIALVYGTVMRNLSIALVISLAYVVQVQSAAWSVKILSRWTRKQVTSQQATRHSPASDVRSEGTKQASGNLARRD